MASCPAHVPPAPTLGGGPGHWPGSQVNSIPTIAPASALALNGPGHRLGAENQRDGRGSEWGARLTQSPDSDSRKARLLVPDGRLNGDTVPHPLCKKMAEQDGASRRQEGSQQEEQA